MKKFLAIIMSCLTAVACCFALTACGKDPNTIYVATNAYFAPFEYYDGTEIVGVDVEIMNKVGEKLGKKVKIENIAFKFIIDNVAKGDKYDCGAAGITITEARQKVVDFSDPYFTSVQYVICKASDSEFISNAKTATDGTPCFFWSDLVGKKIGVQADTTGDIFVNYEIDCDGTDAEEDYYKGELNGSNATCTKYDNAQLAVDAIGGNKIDVVVVDKLPAEYICGKNSEYVCKALYYDADTATEEQYAICVTKGSTELLAAINEVLKDLGAEGVNKLVAKHFGIDE